HRSRRRRARPRRAERGFRVAVARRRTRTRPRREQGERERRRDRDRTSAGDERCPARGQPVARIAAARRRAWHRDHVRRRRTGPGRAVRGRPLTSAYLELGLRLGKHVEGLVDAYYGSPELKAQVDAEGIVDPARLVADA